MLDRLRWGCKVGSMKCILVIILVLCAGIGNAGAQVEMGGRQEKPLVRVGIMAFPGFSEQNEAGEVVGKTVDLTRMLLDQAGYRADIRIMPAARIWRGLESGSVDLWPGILNKPDLEEHTLLTERDLGQVGIDLYYRPGEPEPVLPDALAGKRLILITNYTYVTSLMETLSDPALGLEQVTSISHMGALQMLLKGRGDYLLDYQVQVDAATQELGIAPLPSVQMAEQPMRFILSLKSGFAPELKADLDRAYDELAFMGVDLEVTRQ